MKNKDNNHVACSSVIFKFKGMVMGCTSMIIVTIIIITMAVLGAVEKGFVAGISIALVFIPFTLLAWVVIIATLSDIIVDDFCISRSFAGKIWKKISWVNVRCIKVFDSFDPGTGKSIKAYNIFPIKNNGFHLSPSGKMAFNEKMDRSSEFIFTINKYVAIYQIRIDSNVNGVKTSPIQL